MLKNRIKMGQYRWHLYCPRFLVRVTGFEPAASCSQSRRATNEDLPFGQIFGIPWNQRLFWGCYLSARLIFAQSARLPRFLYYTLWSVQETRCLNLIKHRRTSFFIFLEHLNITAHLEANPVAKRSWNKDFNWWTYPIILDRFVVIIQSESERWNKTKTHSNN